MDDATDIEHRIDSVQTVAQILRQNEQHLQRAEFGQSASVPLARSIQRRKTFLEAIDVPSLLHSSDVGWG